MKDEHGTIEECDVISNIMETVRFKGTIFFHSKLAAPWGVLFQPTDIPRFHIALSGNCFVGINSEPPVKLQTMEIAMVPSGYGHWVADQPNRELKEAEQVGQACQLGNPLFQNGEITNTLMCAMIQYDQDTAHPIFDALPSILHFPEYLVHESVWNTVRLIDGEIRRKGSNSGPIIDRLTEALCIQLLEAYVEKGEQRIGFFAALGDHRLKQALTLIHNNPATAWTLTTLGQKVGMSKATLNRHFHHTVGVTPMNYIKNWKMITALNLVKYSNMPLEQVAEATGFSSARTLNKAFQKYYGQTPSDARKSA